MKIKPRYGTETEQRMMRRRQNRKAGTFENLSKFLERKEREIENSA